MLCRKQDRMTLIASLAVLAFAIGTPSALAQEKSDAKKSTAGASMPALKPAPELAKLNSMAGSWKCTSKMHMPPEMGGEQTGKSTMTIKKDLNGYWVVGNWKMEKTKTMPTMNGTIYWGYDTADKKFVELGVDSTGSYMHGTSAGPQGGTWVWDEDGVMMGKKNKTRTTVNQKSPSATEIKFEMEAEPGKWVPMGEDSCKKSGGSA
ncbi:MAG TPA: DUF1579 family protein [Myxococcaceae bacterium]|nr:DUF1579 family protein [Myxococcaceae bacterium]